MYMCCYLIELEKPSDEDMDVLLYKIDNFNYNNAMINKLHIMN
ncbi:MAG: hypothetical protein BWY15_02370 [Firmicutes bacterium ADurb.Bin193]|nr:MAG: hypothetical protein BWY15_02370 [Firmicutes bacterium ADurb.Bin193]